MVRLVKKWCKYNEKTVFLFFSFFLFWVVLLSANIFPLPENFQSYQTASSVQIYSREGLLLREILSENGGRRVPIKLDDISKDFVQLLISTEDQRFYYHPGIDPLAMIRAMYQWVSHGKIVSGASTLTMQLSRLVLSKSETRQITEKLKECFYALYLEMSLTKREILELYINNLPFGNQLYGLNEASSVYFKKKPIDLSSAESSYLIGIIRGPSAFNPYKNIKQLLVLQKRILNSYFDKKKVVPRLQKNIFNENVVFYPIERKFKAPHFTDFVLENTLDEKNIIQTSLSLSLNEKIEELIKNQISELSDKNVNQASALVISNSTGEILSYVGSANYWNDQYQGMIDGVQQLRQPGSALKPFTYARAIDVGIQPNSILADVKTNYGSAIGGYQPENYDHKYRGPVLLRSALANSLNVPAIELLYKIGVTELYQTLNQLKFSNLRHDPSYYGLGLTLGNMEVSLYELVRGYSVFARKGDFCELTFLKRPVDSISNETVKPCDCDHSHTVLSHCHENIFTQKSISIIRDFLSDKQARTATFGQNGPLDFDYPVMIKTGTSQNYRDNWTVAVTPKYTVGVWVGNFNGDPMQNVSGVTGAAPIAHRIVDYLHDLKPWSDWDDPAPKDKVRVCSLSGKRPTKNCPHTRFEFVNGADDLEICDMHVSRKIDTRNGLLAGPQCPERYTAQHQYLNLPLKYREWQLDYWQDTIAPDDFSDLCPDFETKKRVVESKNFKILSPENGAVYKIDLHRPKEAQSIALKTTHPKMEVVVNLDGQKLNIEDAKHINLVRGRHTLKVLQSLDETKVLDQVVYYVR